MPCHHPLGQGEAMGLELRGGAQEMTGRVEGHATPIMEIVMIP